MLALAVRFDLHESRNDHAIAERKLPGCAAIHADRPGATRRFDGVSGNALAIGDVPDVDALVRQNTCCIKQILIDRDRALIIDIALSDGGCVQLPFQHIDQQGVPFLSNSKWQATPAMRIWVSHSLG